MIRHSGNEPGATSKSRFNPHIAHATDQVIMRPLACLHGQDLDRISVVVGPQDQVLACDFDIPHSTKVIFIDGVHIRLALTIGLERVVMAVDENRCTGQQTRVHAHPLAGIDLDGYETLPLIAVALDCGPQLAQETLLEVR